MTMNQEFSSTMRIAIPLEDAQGVKVKIPKIAKKAHLTGQIPWVVTQTAEQSADHYQELLHSLYDGVLISKDSGRIVDVNARAISQLQYNRHELSRLNVLDIIVGANEQLLQTICKNITNNRFTLIDAYCIRKDKTTFPAEIATNRLILTKEGHLCFFLRDVTKRKKAEEELIQTVSKLKELDNAKSRLVANVSHELRTPLTIINSFVSLVNDGIAGAVSDQQKECLTTVLRNCDRLANLIDDILDLGRIESGREEFKRRRLSLSDLLRQCHHDFLPKFLAKRQQLNLEIPEEVFPDALGDTDKIAQVLTNLVGNANKFTPDNGEITVALSGDGETARIDVIDNGPGIAPDDQVRLFEAFTQVNRPEGGAGSKGTGLGLTISKHIIDAHEGVLKVESEVGKGSRFFFILPLYSEKKAFEAFINDRLRFMQARNHKPAMILVDCHREVMPDKEAVPTAEQPVMPSLQGAVISALGCTDSQVFSLESEDSLAGQAIVALADGADLNKETIANRLQAEIRSRIQDGALSVSFAYLQPARSDPPREWLARVRAMLEPLPVMRGLEQVKRILIVDDDEAVLKMMADILGQADQKIDVRSTASGYDACIHFGDWKPDLVVLD
ncbi:MAG: ATP-binding protein, partial [Kiritimatiellia bacterium]|nr:ATP-binding protein [Kiritimatiellia bacterium]